MIRHILKIMWNQRRSNGWIFAELAVVAAVLWMMIDTFWVDYRTYHAPLGFDIGNVWRFKLSDLDAKAPGYVPDSLYHSSDPEDLTRLMTQIRQNPEVEDVCVTFYSCPYSNGNSWREVKPVDGDTIYAAHMESFQMRNVTPEYFRLFRIRTVDGEPVYDKVAGRHNVIVITPEMAEGFYTVPRILSVVACIMAVMICHPRSLGFHFHPHERIRTSGSLLFPVLGR